MKLIKKLWYGDVSLDKTFLFYGICIIVFLRVVIGFSFIALMFLTPLAYIPLLVTYVFELVYIPFISISIWRSANKYQYHKTFPIVAKAIVIIGVVLYIRFLVIIMLHPEIFLELFK